MNGTAIITVQYDGLLRRFPSRLLPAINWQGKKIEEVRVVENGLETNFGGSDDDKSMIVLHFSDGTISEPFVSLNGRAFNDLILDGLISSGILSSDEGGLLEGEARVAYAKKERKKELIRKRDEIRAKLIKLKTKSKEALQLMKEVGTIEKELETNHDFPFEFSDDS